MLDRLLRYGLAACVFSMVAGGAAYAQDPCGEEDPGADVNPCGELPDEADEADEADEGGGGEETGEVEASTGGSGAAGIMPAEGAINVDLVIELALNAEDSAFGSSGALDPVSISPDVWYGLMPKIAVGVVHSSVGRFGFIGNQGILSSSICVTGDVCDAQDPYHNVGIEGLYQLNEMIAANAGLHINVFDPFTLGLKFGAKGMHNVGKIILRFDPNIQITLNERSDGPDFLNLPIAALYPVNPKLFAGVQTGLATTFNQFGDLLRIPLSLGVQYAVSDAINAGVAFTLGALIGGDGVQSGFDARSLTFVIGYSTGGK